MRKRPLILIFLILILIIVAELLMLRSCTGSRAEDPVPTPESFLSPTTPPATPVPTQVPLPTQPPATLPPTAPPAVYEPTQPPATPSPTPKPTDTPAPTSTPSYGEEISRGSFSSDTGTSMNMNVSWVAYDDGNGNAVISLTGTVTSYSLRLGTIYDGITLELAGHSVSCDTKSIHLEDGAGQTTSPLFYTKITVPLGTCADMTATWRYGGSYSGVSLPTITATGYIYTQ